MVPKWYVGTYTIAHWQDQWAKGGACQVGLSTWIYLSRMMPAHQLPVTSQAASYTATVGITVSDFCTPIRNSLTDAAYLYEDVNWHRKPASHVVRLFQARLKWFYSANICLEPIRPTPTSTSSQTSESVSSELESVLHAIKLSRHWITDRVSHSLASPCWSSLAADRALIDRILTTSYIMIQLRPCYRFIFHQSIGVTSTVSLPILFDLIHRWDPGHERINDNEMFVWQFRLTGNGKGHVTCGRCWPSPWSFCLLKTQFQHTPSEQFYLSWQVTFAVKY